MTMTKEELDKLAALNTQRDPLQGKLVEDAERLFDIWCVLNPDKHLSRYFKSANLCDDGICIQFESGCSCGHGDNNEEITLPLEVILSTEWEDGMRKVIAARQEDERRRQESETERKERAQLATLQAKYTASGAGR